MKKLLDLYVYVYYPPLTNFLLKNTANLFNCSFIQIARFTVSTSHHHHHHHQHLLLGTTMNYEHLMENRFRCNTSSTHTYYTYIYEVSFAFLFLKITKKRKVDDLSRF